MRGSSVPPSTLPMFTSARCITLLRRHFLRLTSGDAPFDLGAEVTDQALDRPRGGIAEAADSVAFALLADFPKKIDVLDAGVAHFEALHHAPHPPRAFAARRTLAA